MLDKGIAFLLRKFGFPTPVASFTGGLVGDASPFAVLPRITPTTTFIIVLLALSPCLFKTWRDPRPRLIARSVAYAYTCGFLFGWHVHEKASLHISIPLALVAVESLEDAKHYFLLSVVSCYSLFPLPYEAQEYPIKVLLLLLHTILMWFCFSALYPKIVATKGSLQADKKATQFESMGSSRTSAKKQWFELGWVAKSYLLGVVVVEIWGHFLHSYLRGDNLPFLPLMSISMYCAFVLLDLATETDNRILLTSLGTPLACIHFCSHLACFISIIYGEDDS
ncbi:putative dolichyl pyrophosphate Glc1Man9GlcNAc2 alpha-1,3-glucosyltransferase [Hibiscus syriacus]|uniref:Alpha-1,3-glucosyltransferase n=1 Tax=Hibiscus syriacus TaxID=106335 RepID=A0A6A2WQM0_HIBSY|nr:probable dolichyl pyrophosphate Glc1Man9GlcNAc2 alpha-1,3-glucosyltransferase [Hibiscus syriacus]KAE8662261.1 putative dolichyl pyrophosphate Glc1Man9GlcNAc2 alpha-1,3-glucosyltransferase [Hibiscus syriacus]